MVYAIPCECELLYIGETKRTAAIRTAEEKAACQKVDKTNKLSNNEYADLGITQHHKETGHTFQFNATKILAFEPNWQKRKLLEGLYIERNKNKLVNIKAGSKLDNSWAPVISKIQHLRIYDSAIDHSPANPT